MFTYNTSSLDTNIILRAILCDIPKQYNLVQNLLSQANHTYLVEDVAVMECVHTLEKTYHRTRGDIVEILEGFFGQKNIKYSRDIFNEVYPLYLKHPKLSFNDIYLSVKSEAASAEPLWTFDQKLASQLQSPKLLQA